VEGVRQLSPRGASARNASTGLDAFPLTSPPRSGPYRMANCRNDCVQSEHLGDLSWRMSKRRGRANERCV
jgi:hypothetical protein